MYTDVKIMQKVLMWQTRIELKLVKSLISRKAINSFLLFSQLFTSVFQANLPPQPQSAIRFMEINYQYIQVILG